MEGLSEVDAFQFRGAKEPVTGALIPVRRKRYAAGELWGRCWLKRGVPPLRGKLSGRTTGRSRQHGRSYAKKPVRGALSIKVPR